MPTTCSFVEPILILGGWSVFSINRAIQSFTRGSPEKQNKASKKHNMVQPIFWFRYYIKPWENLPVYRLCTARNRFPKNHPLQTIFIRQTVKLSYSCMPITWNLSKNKEEQVYFNGSKVSRLTRTSIFVVSSSSLSILFLFFLVVYAKVKENVI